jgi:phosphotyrosine-protein phosphatase (capsular polysaccharide biosynthesis)
MIDLHLHILPGIDDGSSSLEESVRMAKRLSELGFKGAFCTSHYIADSPQAADNQTKNRLREKLQAELDKAGIKLKLLPGNEIYIDPKMVDYLTKGKASCLGGELSSKKKHQHVLFELPFYAEVSYLRDIIFELKAKGLVPILAHPERYLFVQKKKEVIFEIVKLGVKLQSNYGSIVGQYGGKAKKIMKFLLKNRLVSYLGTDIHRAEGSLFLKFEKAEKKIIKLIGEPEYRKIIERGDELAKPFLNN